MPPGEVVGSPRPTFVTRALLGLVGMALLFAAAPLRGFPARRAGVAEPPAPQGTVAFNDFRISQMGTDGDVGSAGQLAAVAYNGTDGEYLVVWQGLHLGETEIYGQRLDAEGQEIGSDDFRISQMGTDGDTDFTADTPAVAYNSTNNEYLVVWAGTRAMLEPSSGFFAPDVEVFGQRINASTGALIGGNFQISDMGPDNSAGYHATRPDVAPNSVDNEYLVVFEGEDPADHSSQPHEIHGQRIDGATGNELGGNDFLISSLAGGRAFRDFEPAVAHNQTGNYYSVVWQGTRLTDSVNLWKYDIRGEILLPTGVPLTPGGPWWYSYMGSTTSHDALSPDVVYNGTDDEFLIVWRGTTSRGDLVTGEFEIFGQLIHGAGGEFGADDFRISDMGADGDHSVDALPPAVAYNPTVGGYLVVWAGDDGTGTLAANELEVFGQRLESETGAEIGPNDLRISMMGPFGDADFQARAPDVARGVRRRYLIVWDGEDNTGALVDGEWEIFGQLLDILHLGFFIGE